MESSRMIHLTPHMTFKCHKRVTSKGEVLMNGLFDTKSLSITLTSHKNFFSRSDYSVDLEGHMGCKVYHLRIFHG